MKQNYKKKRNIASILDFSTWSLVKSCSLLRLFCMETPCFQCPTFILFFHWHVHACLRLFYRVEHMSKTWTLPTEVSVLYFNKIVTYTAHNISQWKWKNISIAEKKISRWNSKTWSPAEIKWTWESINPGTTTFPSRFSSLVPYPDKSCTHVCIFFHYFKWIVLSKT